MKLSDLTDEQWFLRLSARRTRNLLSAREWLARYDGVQPLYFVSKLLSEHDDRFPPLTINWDQKFIDTLDGLCITEGFRVGDGDEFSKDLWSIWQRNDMPEFESENNINSLVTGSGYIVVGPSDDGALITVESPENMAIEIDPRTRHTVASLLFYKSDQEAMTDNRAVLHVAGENGARVVEFENGRPVSGGQIQKWMSQPAKLQSSPSVPVVRYLNRQRQRVPQSELRALSPVVDAANLIATHMLATSHYHAMPRMLAINVAESLFMNPDGSLNKEAVKSATGSMWIIPAEQDEKGNPLPKDRIPDVDVKQLPASDLRNFHESLSLLGRIGAGLCSMSPSEFGFGVSDNPVSAKSQEVSNQNMATRIHRLHTSRGSAHARVMRLAAAVEELDVSRLDRIETVWRDPSKLTKAAMADAAVKTYQSGIADLHQARVDYGYTAATIEAMESREHAAAMADPYINLDLAKSNDSGPVTSASSS